MNGAFPPAVLAITTALFDSLWEGALVAGVVWLGLRCLPALGAATRHAIWLFGLAALVALPVLTVCASGSAASHEATADAVRGEPAVAAAAPPPGAPRVTAPHIAAPEPSLPAERIVAMPAARVARIAIPQALAEAVALVWLLVAGTRLVLLALDLRALAAIRRRARPYSAAHEYPVCLSDRARAPFAAGFFRRTVILPARLVAELRPQAVEAIVVHEVAHLRRGDVWTNALARVALALLAFNPAAWFVVRRLAMEREIACDDWVVARTGAGEDFARTLTALASGAGSRAPSAAASAFGSRHAVVVRVERLLDARPRRLRTSPAALGAALAVLAAVALAVRAVSPVIAYAAEPAARASDLLAAAASGGCAVPNRGVRLAYLGGPRRSVRGARPMDTELPNASEAIARAGASHVAVVDLTVDAAGTPRRVTVISVPNYPGEAAHLTRLLMASTYEPALRGCVPVTATVRTGMPVHPERYTVSVIVPVYPAGWSAAHPSACKVPTVSHARFRPGFVAPTAYTRVLPDFPAAMHDVPVDAAYTASARVHADAAGAATRVALVRPSGQRAFDDALPNGRARSDLSAHRDGLQAAAVGLRVDDHVRDGVAPLTALPPTAPARRAHGVSSCARSASLSSRAPRRSRSPAWPARRPARRL